MSDEKKDREDHVSSLVATAVLQHRAVNVGRRKSFTLDLETPSCKVK